MITEIVYSATNTYLVSGKRGSVLIDTGWAGTFPMLCRALGEKKLRLQDIDALMVTHFHPDHMGIARDIQDAGVELIVFDVQEGYVHSSDHIFEKERNISFVPIDDARARHMAVSDSRKYLSELGIDGEVLHTPGHSDDSVSLWLDKEKALIVGDLPPLYELDAHRGTPIGDTWERLLSLRPKKAYYGHARPADVAKISAAPARTDTYGLVKDIVKLFTKGYAPEAIAAKTGAGLVFVNDVVRMYATHPGVSVQGILDRIEIKGK